MKHKFIRISIILLIIGIAGTGYWYFSRHPELWQSQFQAKWQKVLVDLKLATPMPEQSSLTASGYIEATQITVAAEVGGLITELPVNEGEQVKAGQVLAAINTDLLEAQQAEAEAALAVAQKQLALIEAGARAEDIATLEAAVKVAEAQREAAYQSWQDTIALRDNPQELDLQISAAQTQLAMAEHRIEQLAPLKDAAELVSALRERQVKIIEEGRNFHIEIPRNPQDFSLPDNVDLREDIKGAAPGDDIRAHYNFPEGTKRQAWAGWNLASSEVWSAWTGLNGAVAGQDAAQQNLDNLLTLRNSPQQLQVQAAQAETAFHQAEAAVAVAQANLKLIQAGAPPEQIEIMRTNVAQAQAALDALQVQRQKYTLSAPGAGMILDLPVHTGELAQPGRALLTLGDLSTVDLKLYLPETEMGRVKLGQSVEVTTDTFPGETFTGQVIWISDEAEFTPKNVQTKEQRVNTVFAVKVRLVNPEQKLKPGMPADAVLVEGSGL